LWNFWTRAWEWVILEAESQEFSESGISLPLDQVQYPFAIWGYFGLQNLLNFIVFVFALDDWEGVG